MILTLHIYFHVWLAEDYERFIRPDKGDMVIGIGAHISLYTLKCLKYVH